MRGGARVEYMSKLSKARLDTIAVISKSEGLTFFNNQDHSASSDLIPYASTTSMTLLHGTALLALFSATRFAWAPGGR